MTNHPSNSGDSSLCSLRFGPAILLCESQWRCQNCWALSGPGGMQWTIRCHLLHHPVLSFIGTYGLKAASHRETCHTVEGGGPRRCCGHVETWRCVHFAFLVHMTSLYLLSSNQVRSSVFLVLRSLQLQSAQARKS